MERKLEGRIGPFSVLRALQLAAGAIGLSLVCHSTALGQGVVGAVHGRITNATTAAGVAAAAVEVQELGIAVRTDSLGTFALEGIAVGVHRVTVRAIGYEPVVRSNIVVGSGKTTELHVELVPFPILLEGIVVQPSYFEPPRTGAAAAATLVSEETRRAPGVQEDVVRAVALLPGVGVTSGGRNDLIVRGGAPYENLFIVDGIVVPNINHFGSQGSTGGPLSLINIDLVEQVEFATGGVSARYGNRTAAVTDLTLREGADDRISGEFNLSATGAGAIIEGPVGATTFWLGARRSYLDLLFRAAGFSFVPSYWDFQLKTTTRLTARSTVSFLAVGALDDVSWFNSTADDRYDNSRILAPEQRQYFSGLTWRQLLNDAVLTVTAGRTYVRFDAEQRDSLGTATFQNRSREGQNSLRVDVDWQVTRRWALEAGNELTFASMLDYDLVLDGQYRRDTQGVARPLMVDTAFTALTNATYVQFTHRPARRWEWTAGARFTSYGWLGDVRVEPRVGLRVEPTERTAVWGQVGTYHQAPSYIWLLGDGANRSELAPIRADQAVVGGSYDPAIDLRLQVEAYFKRYPLYPARQWRPQAVLAPTGFEDVTADIPFGLEPLSSGGKGRVYGVEFLARKRFGIIPLYGLASVALMHAEFAGADGIWRRGSYDAPLIANAVLAWRPGPAWELSGKFRYATGLPTTPFVATGPLAGSLDFTRYNAGPRSPNFHAVDLRVDRRWSFTGWQLVFYLDVQNVYGRRNVSGFRWDARSSQPLADEALGVLPSVGVNVEF